jgi:hypothetical protein
MRRCADSDTEKTRESIGTVLDSKGFWEGQFVEQSKKEVPTWRLESA